MADTRSTTLTLKVSRILDAPRSRVFDAWTRADAVAQWFAPGDGHVVNAPIDLRVGGGYRIHIRDAEGKDWIAFGAYREIRAPERLVFSWRWTHDGNVADMIVTLELVERGHRTEVVLTHENLPSEESLAQHEHGWNGCFDKLPAVL